MFITQIVSRIANLAETTAYFGSNCKSISRDTILNDPNQSLQCLIYPIQDLAVALRNVTIALGLLFIIIGAITLATNNGNPEKIEKGKQAITWSIAAIVLAVTFWALIVIFAQIAGIDFINSSGKIEFPNVDEFLKLN